MPLGAQLFRGQHICAAASSAHSAGNRPFHCTSSDQNSNSGPTCRGRGTSLSCNSRCCQRTERGPQTSARQVPHHELLRSEPQWQQLPAVPHSSNARRTRPQALGLRSSPGGPPSMAPHRPCSHSGRPGRPQGKVCRRHLPHGVCSLHVSGARFSGSHDVSNFSTIDIFVMVICD